MIGWLAERLIEAKPHGKFKIASHLAATAYEVPETLNPKPGTC